MTNKPKILVVDDRRENLIALRTVLKDIEIELIEATSGNEALTATLNHQFALALLDIQMPDMDGYELASILREDEKTAALPFIFISAVYTDNLNVFKGYEKGAFSFITKPFKPEILLNKVRFFIEKHQQEHSLRQLNTDLRLGKAKVEEQAIRLKASEEELITRQNELVKANHELEEKSRLLEVKNNELLLTSEELQTKARELELSNQYKSEFLANMSHELRTPLNSILLLSDLLIENINGNLTQEQTEFARVINNSGNSLLDLINDILDLSKIESGKFQLEIETISPVALCEKVREMMEPVARKKQLDFEVTIAPDLPQKIDSDQLKLEQVLKNFLSNAFKFTEKGKVELIARKPDKAELQHLNDPENQGISFEVRDTGIGIPPDKQEIIFNAFQQADGSTRRKYGGTGLGLSISKSIAAMLHGDVILKSKPGEGSSFTLVIPTAIASLSTDLTESSYVFANVGILADDTALENKHVLIVDDDAANIFSLTKLLESRKIKVSSVMNGRDALEFLKYTSRVDLVLMDMVMPDKNGLDTIREIRETENTVRIIGVSVKSGSEDREKCLNAGANDFIGKPIDGDKIIALLKANLINQEA